MGNTIKFTCDSYGYIDTIDHVALTDASWNLKADDVVMVRDYEDGIESRRIPASIRDKYGIASSSYIFCPLTVITINDVSFEGYTGYSGDVFYLINTNLWVEDETVLVGDLNDATKTTELIVNAITARPGGVVDLGDLNKLGYTFMYMANDNDLYWRIDDTTPYIIP
tara:strand:- start:175 stop:675 length:501 start_codon:yes stop_codon:yes gene_type:complete